MKDFLLKVKNKWQTFLIMVFMVVAITFSVSVFIPAKYSSEIKMMIIQNHQSEKVDAFSAAKSAEYLSDIIAKIIFTESFIKNVFEAPFGLEDDLPVFSEERMKAWERKVDVNKQNNTGILTITVLDSSQKQSELLANSVAWALNVRGSYYHGGGDTVQIKSIDGPTVSEKPAVPNVLLNSLFALLIGSLGSLVVIYFFDDFELVLFDKKKNRNGENEDIGKIALSLNKIRENLKNQKADLLLEEEYQIEKKDFSDLVNEGDGIEKNDLNLDDKEIERAFDDKTVNKAEDKPSFASTSAEATVDEKAMAGEESEVPENLPVFEEDEVAEKSEEKNQFSPSESESEVDFRANGNGNSGKNGKDYISLEELNEEAERMGLSTSNHTVQGTAPNHTTQGNDKATKYEASSDEVKERLNKLLRGEL